MSVIVDRALLHTSSICLTCRDGGHRCGCGNVATVFVGAGGLCDECVAHVECVLPENMRTGFGRFGGYVATCDGCGYVCAYWDCVCELAHDCGGAA